MAEKLLNARITLKYDTLSNWTSSNLVLKAGEMAIATIPEPTSGTFDPNKVPVVGIKVGDGTHTFSQLNWIQSIAGDVYAWAKAATKPTYEASEIQNLQEYISGEIQDTDTQYKIDVDSNDGHIFYLKSKPLGGSTWTTVSTVTIPDNNTTYTFAEGTTNGKFTVTPSGGSAQSVTIHGLGTAAYTATTDYDAAGAADAVLGTSSDAATANTVYGAKAKTAALETLVGTLPAGATATTVVGYIDEKAGDSATAAIEALDVTDTAVSKQLVSVVSETDGKISVTRRALVADDIPNLNTSKLNAGTLGVARGGTGAGTFTSGNVLIGNGTSAIQTKAIDTAVTEDSTNLITSGAVKTAIDTATAGLSGAMHFIGVATVPITDGSTADPVISGYDFSKKASGDVVLYNGLEFVWSGSEWVQFGNETSYALKTVTITANNGLTGGGTLEANRTISHAVPTGAGTSNNVTETSNVFLSGITFDAYGHVTSVDTAEAEGTTYTFAEGSTNGAFSVTPADGTAQSVPIHGLDDAAYKGVVTTVDTSADLPTSGAVKTYADGLIAGLDSSVAATAADGNKYSVITGVTETNGKLTAKTEVKLEAIAKTGNVNDLIQTVGDVVVLDCGSSSVNV